MKMSKLFKGVAIALPLFVAVGCSSTSNKTTSGNNGLSSQEIAAQIQQLERMNTVYFGFDQYTISPEYANLLDQHASLLVAAPSVSATIEGHADERGTSEYNIALGERRGNAVKSYLQGRGVKGTQLNVVSYGKEKPAVLGHNAAAYEQNRRAVIVY